MVTTQLVSVILDLCVHISYVSELFIYINSTDSIGSIASSVSVNVKRLELTRNARISAI
jgi:hypothetical protein